MANSLHCSFLAVVVLVLAGCGGKDAEPKKAGPPQQDEQRRALSAGAPGEATAAESYTVAAGDTLATIAVKQYGNSCYMNIIMLCNRIENPHRLRSGQVLRTPELAVILAEERVSAVMPEEVDLILKARRTWMGVEKGLSDLRRDAGYSRVAVPEAMRQAVLSAAADVDKAAAGFRVRKSGVVATPTRTIGQLESISEGLRELAAGANDGYGYDIDMIHQRFVQAMLNAIHWARNGYQ